MKKKRYMLVDETGHFDLSDPVRRNIVKHLSDTWSRFRPPLLPSANARANTLRTGNLEREGASRKIQISRIEEHMGKKVIDSPG